MYRNLVGEGDGNKPLGRPKLRWEDNIISDVTERGLEGVNWTNLAQDSHKWWVINLLVLQIAGNSSRC
jgi:hypothetical protein